ncbi:MAG: hypothetical protein KGJ02_06895 [Verrucomicrobiota bacterium]|nr:hypothetical protein [Verrucomicrobiota bacterium]
MLKKVIFLLSALSLPLCAQKSEEWQDSEGFTMGLLGDSSLAELRYYLTFGYVNDHILFDVGGNFQHMNLVEIENDRYVKRTVNVGVFITHFGSREKLYPNLFFTYGVVGNVSTNVHTLNTYAVGCFTGLDLQPYDHLLFSAKICPISLEHYWSGAESYAVFKNASFNCAYLF